MLLSQMSPLGWDPFVEMRRMQDEMNRLFAGLEGRPAMGAFPPVNVWYGENSVVVTAEIPGVRRDDIDLTIREDTLTIRGTREPEVKGSDVAWHRRERAYGEFERIVDLPFRVDPDRVEARFTNGLLEVELQRPEEDRPKKIRINAA